MHLTICIYIMHIVQMWIDRTARAAIEDVVRTFPVVALIGPRQVGKTSMLERYFPNHRYVALDVGSNAEMAETRPEDFLARYPPPLLLDEVQYAPRFFRRIKTYVDQHRGESGLFLLTGSQNFLLMDALADSLAGRVAVVPLLGLSAEEWRAAGALADSHGVADFVWRGTYPALWADLEHAPNRDRWYQSYLATYLERDVRSLLRVGSLRDFERFLRACAARTGQLLNVSKLGRDVGISHTTASKWLSVLQASNQIFLLEPYYRSLGKRLAKSPKLYFTDTGLASFLMSLSSARAAWSSASAGALWETHVVGQWLRHRDWKQPSLGLWYYRDQQGREVDLVIERDQRLHGIECKLTERPSARDLRGLRALSKLYGDQVASRTLACTTDEVFEIECGVQARSGFTTWPLDD